MRRSLLLIAISSLFTGCGPRPTPISVENRAAVQLQSVFVSGFGFNHALGDIAPGQTVTTQLSHGGPTALALAFTANGRQVVVPPQGYFEGNGRYVVSVVVTPDLVATVDGKWCAD